MQQLQEAFYTINDHLLISKEWFQNIGYLNFISDSKTLDFLTFIDICSIRKLGSFEPHSLDIISARFCLVGIWRQMYSWISTALFETNVARGKGCVFNQYSIIYELDQKFIFRTSIGLIHNHVFAITLLDSSARM